MNHFLCAKVGRLYSKLSAVQLTFEAGTFEYGTVAIDT
jgi:hypothetical protein